MLLSTAMPQCKDHSEDFRSQHDLCSEGRVEGEWPTAMVDDDWLESWAQTSQRGSLPKFGHDTDFGWFRMVLVHAGASPRLCLLLGDGRFQVLEVGAAMDAFQRLHCPCVGQGDAGRKKHSAMSCGHQVYLRRLLAKQGTLQHPCPGYPTFLCYS